MKHTLFLIVLFLQIIPHSNGQAFALANQPVKKEFTVYSPANFTDYNPHRKMCIVAKTGLISMGAGMITGVIGLAFIISNDGSGDNSVNGNQGDLGLKMLVGGAILTGVGGCLAIGGGINDIVRHHRERWSMISPKKNQIGIAYNF